MGSRLSTVVFLGGLLGSIGWWIAALASQDETATVLSLAFLLLACSFGGLSLLSMWLSQRRNPIRFAVHALQILAALALTPALALTVGIGLAIAPLILLLNFVAWTVSLLIRAANQDNSSQ